MVPYTLGLTIDPLGRDFGWTRTQITAGVTLASILAIPLSPFVGALIDRWGVRRLALPGVILTALAVAGFGLADGSLAQWMTLWVVFALAAQLVSTTVWITAVSSQFAAGRSLALGVTLSGSAFAATVAPPLTQWLTDDLGWREAYLLLGLGWGAPVLLLCALFLFDAQDRGRRSARDAAVPANADLPGLTVRQAVCSLPLIRIGLATLGTLVLSTSLIVHKVPILTEAGVTRETAALLASLSGVATIVGKLATGWLMERFDAGWVGSLTNSAMALALLLLLEPFRTPALIVVSMLVVGYAGGTKLQICAYLTSMYGGMRNFGKIFGLMASLLAFGGGIGPVVGGIAYDLTGSYNMLIMIGAPCSLLCGLLLIRLGPFPKWSAPAHDVGAVEGSQ